ncbi:Assimilatory nitrite reductase [NAD(P)H] small subunit [Aquisphaera giovannonii]|uniref:Assimilatory nitrite reductase [NAD(P)H] small subunit n=1 Tax=Aquisphaera giovannonii TaxID=406548 RepID=A0A5B9WA91_9BACT|nr:Rieske (2Fe-2S) protein [Aquisphaera giovannonii]QEH36780.1 Assimilatory nitrite reductase [NAD(P)H] small subunit [Aquisphaera giovannonii]
MPEWYAACGSGELDAGRAILREVGGLKLALLREGDSIVALSDRCPHAGGSLGRGWVEEGELVCPLHRWRFRLADGRCTTMRGQSVHRFRAERRGEEVWVLV